MNRQETTPSMQSRANYYLAKPKSGKGPPVLVLHAWWGLNEFFKKFCDRLAEEGFVALAPDLYHGAVASTIEQADKLISDLQRAVAAQDLAQAVEQLQAISGPNTRGIGVIGFSMGGNFAVELANWESSPVVATVVFYATRSDGYASSHSAFQFHLAETDEYEPPSEVEKLRASLSAAGAPAELYIYPGTTHWFFESDRPGAYNAQAAQLAWNRTVDFLRAHLEEV